MINTKIPIYGISILTALFLNIIILIKLLRKTNLKPEEILGIIIYENIGIILGAKLFSYIQNFRQYKTFDLLRMGLSSYGAVIGALVFVVIFSVIFRKKIIEVLKIFIQPIPLMYAIGKIGCFFAGCCHGIKYNGLLAVTYNYSLVAPKGVKFFPVQIIETIVFLLIFIYMYNKSSKRQFKQREFGISLILCGGGKFMLDFLRISHVNVILSLNQIVSIVFIIIGIYMLVIEKNKKVKNEMR